MNPSQELTVSGGLMHAQGTVWAVLVEGQSMQKEPRTQKFALWKGLSVLEEVKLWGWSIVNKGVSVHDDLKDVQRPLDHSHHRVFPPVLTVTNMESPR